MLEITSTSEEYLPVSVAGNYTADDVVHMAILPHGQKPTLEDWQVASWDAGKAKAKIGPGGQWVLEAGVYGVWVRVTTADERPEIYSGPLKII